MVGDDLVDRISVGRRVLFGRRSRRLAHLGLAARLSHSSLDVVDQVAGALAQLRSAGVPEFFGMLDGRLAANLDRAQADAEAHAGDRPHQEAEDSHDFCLPSPTSLSRFRRPCIEAA